jgi:hypothetical protein
MMVPSSTYDMMSTPIETGERRKSLMIGAKYSADTTGERVEP